LDGAISTTGDLTFTGAKTISGLAAAIGTNLTVNAGAANALNNVGGDLVLDAGDGFGSGATGTLKLGTNSDTITIGADGVTSTTLAGSFTLPGATVTDGTDTLTIAHESLAFTGTTGGTVSSAVAMTVKVVDAGENLTIDTNAGSVIVGTTSTLVQVDSTLEVEGTITS
ncbi:hypothetical protein KIPB_017061, partial [Kipferlia bialata]